MKEDSLFSAVRNKKAEMGSESKGLSPSSSWSPAIKKIIRNLKEVVDSPEHEIYDVLVECDMNPDEAVQRLLSQGLPFFC